MTEHGQSVHEQRIADQVDLLALAADAVGSSEEQRVNEVAVDRFGVVSTRIEAREIRIVRWDRTNILGPVEALRAILFVRMEPDRDGAATKPVREPIIVVPAVHSALVTRSVGADAPERLEDHLAAVRQPPDADRTILRVERDDAARPSGLLTNLSSTCALLATRRPSFRRGVRAPFSAAATRLIGTNPRSRSSSWWWTPRSAVS